MGAAKAKWVHGTTGTAQLYRDQSSGTGSEKCTTPEENRGVMVESLWKTFSQVGTFDPTAASKARQQLQQPRIVRAPSAARIPATKTKLGAGYFGGDAECPGGFWKGAAGPKQTQ